MKTLVATIKSPIFVQNSTKTAYAAKSHKKLPKREKSPLTTTHPNQIGKKRRTFKIKSKKGKKPKK